MFFCSRYRNRKYLLFERGWCRLEMRDEVYLFYRDKLGRQEGNLEWRRRDGKGVESFCLLGWNIFCCKLCILSQMQNWWRADQFFQGGPEKDYGFTPAFSLKLGFRYLATTIQSVNNSQCPVSASVERTNWNWWCISALLLWPITESNRIEGTWQSDSIFYTINFCFLQRLVRRQRKCFNCRDHEQCKSGKWTAKASPSQTWTIVTVSIVIKTVSYQ